MELSEAVTQHMEWKVRLRTALASGQTVEVETAADECNCALGRWLNGDAGQRYAKLDSYRACVETHTQFHRAAGRVVQCIGEGRETEAKAMLAMSGEFSTASAALIEALQKLRQDRQ